MKSKNRKGTHRLPCGTLSSSTEARIAHAEVPPRGRPLRSSRQVRTQPGAGSVREVQLAQLPEQQGDVNHVKRPREVYSYYEGDISSLHRFPQAVDDAHPSFIVSTSTIEPNSALKRSRSSCLKSQSATTVST
ncbi:hypothetical protein TKK_0015352 [Trichogramma kaykai]